MIIEANLVDIHTKTIYPAEITIKDKIIYAIKKIKKQCNSYILPGFIDAHIHIESSMLPPSEFARIAVTHGTVATISDPHEIANVLGIEGVNFMIKNGKNSGFKFYFGASPCVPATPFETNGATLASAEIDKLLQRDDIYYLSEVMNFAGIIHKNADMLTKIALAKKYNKPIDGHAPALRGKDLQIYIDAGIKTDHEAFTYEEAKEKLQRGMKIQIRQGSAAKNYEALHPLIDEYYENLMFCSDDKHPNDLVKGHINELVKQALLDGHDFYKVLQIASLNPIKHYRLDVGTLRVGDKADFIEVRNLQDFTLLRSFIDGNIVFEKEKIFLKEVKTKAINKFNITKKSIKDFEFHQECKEYKVIDAIDGQLFTKEEHKKLKNINGIVMCDKEQDILFISVTNRYENAHPSLAFIHGFGLKEGAIASSVAHDSHNIVAIGCDAKSLLSVVNTLISSKGGICAADSKGEICHLPLDIAGLMSTKEGFLVAREYEKIDKFVKERLKSNLHAPFMTLSFMALLVIGDIKLSDKGLFDTNNFYFTKECVL